MTTHFFTDRALAERVREAIEARGVACSELIPAERSPEKHCCADDCCGQSPCRDSERGVEFFSSLTQREVHEVALAQGGHHQFRRGGRCRFCDARE